MRNKLMPLLMIFACALYISGCDIASKRYRETKELMGTIVHIDVCKADAKSPNTDKAYQLSWDRIRDISERMYVLNQSGDVAKINDSMGNAVTVEGDTHEVLRKAQKYYNITGGAFDITVWPLIDVWRTAEKKNHEPSPEDIRAAQARVSTDYIDLKSDNQVQLTNSGVKVDLGGIAKGYAIDEAARLFRNQGIENFYIDAGGDIFAGGKNCKGKAWRVGIRDPQNIARVYTIVEVEDKAVATSGNYEQYFKIKGKQWSHIIDPQTGYPQAGVISSTVIAPSATEADALATALCVKGGAEGTALIDNYNRNYASLIITKSPKSKVSEYKSVSYDLYHQAR